MTARSRRAVLAGLLVTLAACGTPEATPRATSAATSPATGSPLPVTSSPAASPTPTADEGEIAADPPPLALEEVATGISEPIGIEGTPDGWLLVNERNGRVVAVDPDAGVAGVTLDITGRVRGGSEQGLLGLAVHPDWPEDPRAYVHYTDEAGDTVLSEFRVTDEPSPPPLDPTTERVLLGVDQPYANHNGGQLAFGPDGFLYMALGDGGSGGDPHGNGQNPATLLGSILRIDVDASDDPYGIPEDNPFADGEDGAPQVFLYGLRNPWRFSFDRPTGLLWIADVGQNAVEEVNRVDPTTDAGANLGWNVLEGSHCFVTPACQSDGLVMPVAEYGREFGRCSVTGGYVYRGESIPDLRGWYLFGDYCSGTLFGIPSDAEGVIAPRVLLETGARVSAFGQDADGELYLADLGGGAIYRIVAAP